MASMVSMTIDSRRLKSSPSTGDWLRVRHWIPTPATSYRAKYLDPRPNAVVDIKDCRHTERERITNERNVLKNNIKANYETNKYIMCMNWNMGVIHGRSSYRYALLKGSDLVVSHLFSYGHIHVGYITQKVDDSSTCWGQFCFRVQHRHQKTSPKEIRENIYMTLNNFRLLLLIEKWM